MAIDKATAALNFAGGINGVSYLGREQYQPKLPQTKRIIYFNEDAAPSNLSKLFRSFNGNNLVDKVCKPSGDEFKTFQAQFPEKRAIAALQWLQTLDGQIEPHIQQKAKAIIMQLAEFVLKEQVQRNLLKQV